MASDTEMDESTIYHYTTEENMNAICETGIILPSHENGPHGQDAALGEGVYFTQVTPENSTEEIIHNNYDGAANQREETDPHVAEAFIAIPRDAVEGTFCTNTPDGRNICLVPTDTGVDLTNIP